MTVNETKRRRNRDFSPELMENQLEAALGMLAPRPEFVQTLRTRLTTEPDVIMEERRVKATAFLIIALGLFSGAFLLWWLFYWRARLRKPNPSSL